MRTTISLPTAVEYYVLSQIVGRVMLHVTPSHFFDIIY